jgi:hypothetical protein
MDDYSPPSVTEYGSVEDLTKHKTIFGHLFDGYLYYLKKKHDPSDPS